MAAASSRVARATCTGGGGARARGITTRRVQANAGQRGHELESPEAEHHRLAFTVVQQQRPQATAREVGVDEECADPGGVPGGIEFAGIATRTRVAAEHRAPAAPPAAPGKAALAFDGEVAAIAGELRVHAERAAQRAFHL